jgi:tetratricopeptide (TPR) repeat protein
MRIGPYEVGEELGRGGMARVFRARGPQGEEVALKVVDLKAAEVDPQLVLRFLKEVEAARRVDHAAIARVHDAGREDGHAYMAMELLPGGALDAQLRAGPLPVDRALAIARRLAGALAAAHAQGVLHRDLKPANVLLDGEGQAYLADFGLARILDASRMTKTGEVLGTPNYMAPEQALGEAGRMGSATDVYGLGATLYALLTGRPPFPGRSLIEVMTKVVSDPVEPPSRHRSDLDPALEAIVLRCLAKEPADRFDSMQALLEALEGSQRGGGGLASAAASGSRARTAAAALVLVAAAVGAGLLAARAAGTDRQPAPVPSLAASVEATPAGAGADDLPFEVGALVEEAEALLRSGDVEGGLRLLEPALAGVTAETDPDTLAALHYTRGTALLLLARESSEAAPSLVAQAQAAFGAALEARPNQTQALLRWASTGLWPLTREGATGDAVAPGGAPLDPEAVAPLIEAAERCLSLQPAFRPTRLLRALLAVCTDDRERAREELELYFALPPVADTLSSDPAEDRAMAHYNRGLLRKADDPEGALADLALAAEHPGRAEQALVEAALIHAERWELAEAESIYERLLELSEGAPRYLELRGRVRLRAGQRVGALEDFEQAVRLGRVEAQPLVETTRERQGAVHVLDDLDRKRDYPGVLARLERWPELDDPHAQYFFGTAKLELGHARADEEMVRGSLEHFDASLRARPDNASVRAQRGRALRRVGRAQAAVEDYLVAWPATKGEDHLVLLYNLALALKEAGDPAEGAEAFGRLLAEPDLRPELRPKVLLARARALRSAGRFEQASELVEELLELPAWRDEALVEQAMGSFSAGEDAQTLARLRTLFAAGQKVSLNPATLAAALPVAYLLGDLEGTRQLGEAVLPRPALDPSLRLRIQLAVGRSWLAEGEVERAERLAKDARPDTTAHPLAELLVAVCRLRSGDRQAARGALGEALDAWKLGLVWDPSRLEREWASSWLEVLDELEGLAAGDSRHTAWRAQLLALHGRYEEALAILSRLVEGGPDSHVSRLQRGWTRQLAGDGAGAREDLQRVARSAPHARQAALYLAELEHRQGRSQEAEAILVQLLAREGSSEAFLERVRHDLRRARGELTPWR